MATAQTIINDALKEIGVLAEGETPTATMSDDALRALNRLIELLSNDKPFAYSNAQISKVLTGQTSFTVGPTGDLVNLRPIQIDSATVIRSGVTFPVEVLDSQQWDAITYKAATGSVPEAIYYSPTMDNGTVNLWPITTGGTLYMRITNVVTSFANFSTALAMPPGYEECLIKNLAVNLSPQYPIIALSKITLMAAANSLKKINRVNRQVPRVAIDSNLFGSNKSNVAAIVRGY